MKEESPIYQHDVVEFVTVAVQYCAALERAEERDKVAFVATMVRLLPLLYLKGELMPRYELLGESEPQDFVTEEDYEEVRSYVASVMGADDDYLDVFVDDMKYSETPILCTVSENLTDIYQDLKNFVATYRLGAEDAVFDAIAMCKSNFETYWGVRLTNVLRALHEVKYRNLNSDGDDDY